MIGVLAVCATITFIALVVLILRWHPFPKPKFRQKSKND